MNKDKLKYLRPIVLLLLIGIAVAVIVVANHVKKSHATAFVAKPSCSVLTIGLAEQVAGKTLTKQSLKPAITATNTTTFCAYRGRDTSVSLATRTAKNKDGISLNKAAFSSPPVSSEVVRGYGDAAFWTPAFGQLNILQHNTWYILSSGSNTPSQRTLAQTEQFANKIIQQL